jgi:hypothetical protein
MAIVTKPLPLPVWAESGEKVQPSNAEIAEGWPLSATPPSRQRFNWILGYSAQIGRYLMQNGIASWDADETYPPGAVVLHDGKLWVSQRENHGVPPGTSQADWGGSSGIIVDDSGNDLMTLIEQLREKDAALDAKDAALGAKDADLQAQIDQLKNSSGGGVSKIIAGEGVTISPSNGTGDVTISASGGGGGGVTPPPPPDPDGGVMDYGGWRIMMGKGNTTSGYLDEIDFVAPFDGVFAISITEGNAVGWGTPGAGGHIPAGPSVFGWTRHPTNPNNKFLISVGLRNGDGDFIYTPGVTFSYIAYGKKPE